MARIVLIKARSRLYFGGIAGEEEIVEEIMRRFRVSRDIAEGVLERYIAEKTCVDDECREEFEFIKKAYGVTFISSRIRRFLESITIYVRPEEYWG